MIQRIKRIPRNRFVLITSLPSFIATEIFFAGLYFLVIQGIHQVYTLLSLGTTAQIEANMQLFSPLNIVIFFIAMGIMGVLMCLEMLTIIAITTFDYYRDDHIPLSTLIRFSYSRLKGVFRIRAIPFFVFIFLFPKEFIGPKGLFSLNLPPFIFEEIFKFPVYIILITLLLVGFLLFLYRSLFVFHYILLERATILRAFKLSFELTAKIGHKKILWTFFKSLIWIILFTLPIVAFGVILTKFLVYSSNFLGEGMLFFAGISNWMVEFLSVGIPGVLFLATLTIAYIRYAGFGKKHFEKRFHFLKTTESTPRWKNMRNAFVKKYPIILIIILVILAPIFAKIIFQGDKITLQKPLIISHRGTTEGATQGELIENTIPAILEAKKQGADIVEIDVYENKDGTLILSHDSNLKRIAGVNTPIYELSDSQIQQITLANNTKIPTLESVLKIAKEDDIQLMIEPKTHGHEKHLYQELVRLLIKYEMIPNIYIHSFHLDGLEKIKKLNPHIRVGHLIFGGMGNFSAEPVDFFSLQETVATRSIVRNIHRYEKKVFLWTVNNPDDVRKYMDLGVNGFITDQIVAIKNRANKILKSNQLFPSISFRFFGQPITGEDISKVWNFVKEKMQSVKN